MLELEVLDPHAGEFARQGVRPFADKAQTEILDRRHRIRNRQSRTGAVDLQLHLGGRHAVQPVEPQARLARRRAQRFELGDIGDRGPRRRVGVIGDRHGLYVSPDQLACRRLVVAGGECRLQFVGPRPCRRSEARLDGAGVDPRLATVVVLRAGAHEQVDPRQRGIRQLHLRIDGAAVQ